MSLSQSAVSLMDVSSAQKNWVFAQYVYPSLCSRGWTLMGKCSFMVGNTYVRLCFSQPVARHDIEVIVFQPYTVGDWTEDIKLAASQDLYVLCPQSLHRTYVSFPCSPQRRLRPERRPRIMATSTRCGLFHCCLSTSRIDQLSLFLQFRYEVRLPSPFLLPPSFHRLLNPNHQLNPRKNSPRRPAPQSVLRPLCE